MVIRHLAIRNFRGIRTLDWNLDAPAVCLVGPGDSTKTTILDAIELVLSPRWNITFQDSDFYACDVREPISIEISIGNLSDELLAEFDSYVRGWNQDSGLLDEPEGAADPILTVRLAVDSTLEPKWSLIKDAIEERPLSGYQRERFGMMRCGQQPIRQLSYAKGTAISSLAGKTENLSLILAQAVRSTNRKIESPELKSSASEAQRLARPFGVAVSHSLEPKLGYDALSLGRGAISLHDGEIPFGQRGNGAQKLLALSIQLEQVQAGGILLIDELENSLEPYQIRNLVAQIKAKASPNQTSTGIGQVVLTTVSPFVSVTVEASDIFCVHSHNGATTIERVPRTYQGFVRNNKTSEALFSARIIVTEGATEFGLLQGLDQNGGSRYAAQGVALIDGEGSSAPRTALDLAKLGYVVAIFFDSDRSHSPDRAALESAGVCVIEWEGESSTEQRIASDFTIPLLRQFVEMCVAEFEASNPLPALRLQITGSQNSEASFEELAGLNEQQLRLKIAEIAGSQGWIKKIAKAARSATLVAKAISSQPDTNLARTLLLLDHWTGL